MDTFENVIVAECLWDEFSFKDVCGYNGGTSFLTASDSGVHLWTADTLQYQPLYESCPATFVSYKQLPNSLSCVAAAFNTPENDIVLRTVAGSDLFVDDTAVENVISYNRMRRSEDSIASSGRPLDLVALQFSILKDIFAVADSEGYVSVFDLSTAALTSSQRGRGDVCNLTFSPHHADLLISASREGIVQFTDMKAVKSEIKSIDTKQQLRTLAYCPDGIRLAFGTEDSGIRNNVTSVLVSVAMWVEGKATKIKRDLISRSHRQAVIWRGYVGAVSANGQS